MLAAIRITKHSEMIKLPSVMVQLGAQNMQLNNVQKRFLPTFGNSITGNKLWNMINPKVKSKGRGKRAQRREKQDLGKGKVIGDGEAGILWPGLNAQLSSGEVRERTTEEKEWFNKQKEEKLAQQKRYDMQQSLEQWSGGRWGGIKLPTPETSAGRVLHNFNSNVMEVKRVSHMNANEGRIYSIRAIVAVGNGDGLFGIGMISGKTMPIACRKAQMRAMNHLQYIDRCEDRTVYEDMYVNHHRTFMHIRKQSPGYRLRCHRAIMTMCRLMGIKDLHVKINGSTTMINLIKCFLKAVHSQESYQEKANRLGYHLVEYDEMRGDYPVLLASPENKSVNIEPYDEYNAYLEQNIVKARKKKVSVIYPRAMGPPVPNRVELPSMFNEILNSRL